MVPGVPTSFGWKRHQFFVKKSVKLNGVLCCLTRMSTHFHDFFTIFFRNPDYRKARYNPIRRLYRAPMNFVEFNILSKLTKDWKKARGYRHAIVTTASFLGLIWTISYYSLYKGNNWTDVGILKVFWKFQIKFANFSEIRMEGLFWQT